MPIRAPFLSRSYFTMRTEMSHDCGSTVLFVFVLFLSSKSLQLPRSSIRGLGRTAATGAVLLCTSPRGCGWQGAMHAHIHREGGMLLFQQGCSTSVPTLVKPKGYETAQLGLSALLSSLRLRFISSVFAYS